MHPEKAERTDITIVIPLYKGGKYIPRLLDMMERNCRSGKLYERCGVEVVFVNDYPDEEIVISPGQYHFKARVIRQEKNGGIHAARVCGISHSESEYLIMLDQDDLVKETWLYSQWNRIRSEGASFCVCNGWADRFRVLWRQDVFGDRVNDLGYYLATANAILSPGQVIIRREAVPSAWCANLLSNNGSDDFLLWIMVLKRGDKFVLNNEYLYYHTPDRTENSVKEETILRSAGEAGDVLARLGLLAREEQTLLDGQIRERRDKADKGDTKFRGMFFTMYNWMRLRQRGIGIAEYFERKGYRKIAIYGMGYLGACLYRELRKTCIRVSYGMDRSAVDFEGELRIFRIEDDMENVDAVVVTILEDLQEISDQLTEKMGCPTVTLPQVLTDLNGGLMAE